MDIEELHRILLEILIEFDRICRKHGIKYSLAFGTLLGAERHRGFIPWDDDIDVMMDRQNFDLFCKVCPSEMNDDYFLQTKDTDVNYVYNIARLRKNNSAYILEKWKDSGIHQGVYIDLYPIDNLPNSRLKRIIQKYIIIFLTVIRISANRNIFFNGKMEVKKAKKNLLYKFACIFPRKVLSRYEKYIITKYDKSSSKSVGCICEGGVLYKMTRDMMPFSREILNGYEDVIFENKYFMAVHERDGILTHWYDNWKSLPPIEQRKSDHNPIVFDGQKSYIEYI